MSVMYVINSLVKHHIRQSLVCRLPKEVKYEKVSLIFVSVTWCVLLCPYVINISKNQNLFSKENKNGRNKKGDNNDRF
jgi:hypothetical protein